MDSDKKTEHIQNKINELKNYLKDKKCILGFSGGSDSCLIAYLLSHVSPESKLVSIDNMMMPRDFIEYTIKKADEFNLEHEIIQLNFLEDEEFIQNTSKRCYNCRDLMYYHITQLKDFDKYDYFIEGTNITDLTEDRPGILITDKYNMTSPLVECSVTKEDVIDMIEYLGLEYSYNTTCLATRIKNNQSVCREKLDLIDKSEEFLRKNISQENIRLRLDDYNATITVDCPLEILDKKLIKKIRDELLSYGLKKISLDITGYQKSKLEASKDYDNTYYYQLPYSIDLKKTYEKLENNDKYTYNAKIDDDYIEYEDIKINKNGKISIDDKENFIIKFNDILPVIHRKI